MKYSTDIKLEFRTVNQYDAYVKNCKKINSHSNICTSHSSYFKDCCLLGCDSVVWWTGINVADKYIAYIP